jgi:thiol-disulfide isomerase/thioredoxin
MKHRIFSLFTVACLVAGCATTKQYDGPGPFDESADAGSQVTHAIVEANEFDKNVLLVFGANWCSDSRATINLFETNSTLSTLLSDSFVVERIDVGPRGSGRNAALVGQYHAATDEGIPVLVVLDKSGRRCRP